MDEYCLVQRFLLHTAGPPALGVNGGDVIIQCSSSVDSLTHLHDKEVYTASSGANGNPEEGSQAPKRMKREQKTSRALIIHVPPGTNDICSIGC